MSTILTIPEYIKSSGLTEQYKKICEHQKAISDEVRLSSGMAASSVSTISLSNLNALAGIYNSLKTQTNETNALKIAKNALRGKIAYYFANDIAANTNSSAAEKELRSCKKSVLEDNADLDKAVSVIISPQNNYKK